LQNGFKKVFPDNVDKEYFYWQKDLKHTFLKGLHIIVEGDIIVYCKAPKRTASPGYDNAIYCIKSSEKNLTNVLEWLTEK
jgi:hypothetical protein